MTLFSLGPLYIGAASDADCCIFHTGTAWVVHLWIIQLAWDCIRIEDRGPVQKDCDQPGHGST